MHKIVSLIAVATLCVTSCFAQAETITMVADTWCPYNCEPAAQDPGFLVEITQRAFEKHGIGVEYKVIPWAKAIEQTRAGKYTALVGASTNDAPDFVFPVLESGWMSMQFFTAKNSKWSYVSKSSLAQVRLGVADGYAYGPAVDSYIEYHRNNPSRVVLATGNNVLEDNIDRLLSGKVDAILEDRHVMAYYLEKHGMKDQIREAGKLPVSDQNNLYIAFSPKEQSAKRYATLLSDEILAMRQNGELTGILKKYGLKDWRR